MCVYIYIYTHPPKFRPPALSNSEMLRNFRKWRNTCSTNSEENSLVIKFWLGGHWEEINFKNSNGKVGFVIHRWKPLFKEMNLI